MNRGFGIWGPRVARGAKLVTAYFAWGAGYPRRLQERESSVWNIRRKPSPTRIGIEGFESSFPGVMGTAGESDERAIPHRNLNHRESRIRPIFGSLPDS